MLTARLVALLCFLRQTRASKHSERAQPKLYAATHNQALSVGAWGGGGEYLIVSARNNEDMSFLRRHHDAGRRPVMVLDKTSNGHAGGEGSTYLWFILQNYHCLPSWIFFMQADEFHWHHASSVLRSMMLAPNRTGLNYLNVNHGDPDRHTQPYEMILH